MSSPPSANTPPSTGDAESAKKSRRKRAWDNLSVALSSGRSRNQLNAKSPPAATLDRAVPLRISDLPIANPGRGAAAAAQQATSAAQSLAVPSTPPAVAKGASPSMMDAAASLKNVSAKKRPYRRTKRPKNYNDKSTITTTTSGAPSLNVYDAVLQESQDILLAASEAQQLGRLKMASAYLLLVHARLVGLGRRLDRAREPWKQQHHVENMPVESPRKEEGINNTSDVATTPAAAAMSTTPPNTTPKTRAVRELAQFLPNNIEMDQAMMEHLAKAAAELQAARMGRPIKSKAQDAREFFAQTANEQGVTNAATSSSGIAWTDLEIAKLQKALDDGVVDSAKLVHMLPGRTEQQVKVYLRNQTERKRVQESMFELEAAVDTEAAEASLAAAIKKKGRGRKPATTAINTVPYAVCDTRALLQGATALTQKHDESQGGSSSLR